MWNVMDKVKEKARKLLDSGRVELLNPGVYNVVGDHGTYIVAVDQNGNVSCNCLGFLSKNRCSHAVSVLLMTKRKRRILKS